MTDERINAAIAEACGWTQCRLVAKVVLSTLRDPVAYGIPPNATYEIACLNYATDLNAMHEAEKVLIKNDFTSDLYLDYLMEVVMAAPAGLSNHATARERAEAFLRTLSKWEEAQP